MRKGKRVLSLLIALCMCMMCFAVPSFAAESGGASVELAADKVNLETSAQDQTIKISMLLHNPNPAESDIQSAGFELVSEDTQYLVLAEEASGLTDAFGIGAATYIAATFTSFKMEGQFPKPITEKEVTLMTINATLKANAPAGEYKIKTKDMIIGNTTGAPVIEENQEITIVVKDYLKGAQTVTFSAFPQAGGQASAVIASGEKFTASFGDWTNSKNQTVTEFADDDEYTVTVTLTAADGSTFDSGATVNIAGDSKGKVSNVQVAQGGKTLTFTYKYSMLKQDQTITVPASQTVKFGTSFDLSTVCRGVSGATLAYTVDGTLPSGTSVNGSVITAGTTAGDFNIKVNSAAFGDYRAAAEKTIAVSIRDKDSQVFRAGFDTAVSKTYGDAAFGNKTASLTTGNGKISYSSSNPEVAAVDANTGRVTIAGAGTTTITATAAETADYAATSVSYTLTAAPKSVAKPAAVTSSFTYNGQEQTYNVRTSGDYTVTGNKATAAGNHTVTVALNDKANTAWADGTTADITFDFVIAKASVTVTAKDKTVYIGGTVPALPETPAVNTDYTVTGLAAGDTLVSVALKYQKDGQDVADVTAISTSEAAVYDIVITAALADETNYNTPITLKNGKLTIRTKPSGGGHGGGNAASQTPDENKPSETTSEAGIKTAPDFADVPAGHWAKDAVNYVCTNGLFQGISANAFGPDVAMSRGMLVTVLWRLDGRSASGAAVFSDVDSDAYYFEAVAWANANGIVKGIDDAHFAPNSNITREQMAVILERYAELKGYKADSAAADISAFADREQISAYALDGVAWANAAGLMNGRTETTLAPKGETTRAEVATIVQRFAQNVVKH